MGATPKATLEHAELEVLEAGALVGKLSFSACLSVTDASTLKLCQTVQKPLCIIRGRVELESVIHSDGWRGYDGLVDLGYQKHSRVEYGNNEFANKQSHMNGIESFWAFAKTRLVRFRGLHKHIFYFHLKECKFRFNHRREAIYKLVLKMLRNFPLS